MKRALLSVWDKTGIAGFAAELSELGYEIVSTGSTHKLLKENSIPAVAVEDYTGFPEMLDGRLKTLHPKIHGGILAARDDASHMESLSAHSIGTIDIVANNLYPFCETILKPGTTLAEAIEKIDIGGPSMLRAAAKNYRFVTVICDPADYGAVLEELEANGKISEETNFALAAKVFMHTAHYEAAIADYLRPLAGFGMFPETLTVTYEKLESLRYGENPHQKAAFYKETGGVSGTLAGCVKRHGKELSFCNINDANGALGLVSEFDEPAAVAVKHATPCGVGCGETVYEAYTRAYAADPKSIHGGILAFNREVDTPTAAEVNKIFIDVVLAPSFSREALAILTKKKNIRLLEVGGVGASRPAGAYDIKKVSGGLLVQETDDALLPETRFTVVTKRGPTPSEIEDLLFAWKIVKHVKSNGIAIAKAKQSLGVGGGQVNRVWAAEQAIDHCVEALGADILRGAALASDAFMPFPDCVEAAHRAGVTAVIQPGGSLNDGESIEACDRYGMAMVFTGMRHFKH